MFKRPLSKHYPILAPVIREIKVSAKSLQFLNNRYNLTKNFEPFPFLVYKSRSLLYRKLGNSDSNLQIAKVKNLKIVVPLFDNLEIKPGQILSFWKIIKRPTYKKGFVDGMLLADGKITTGVGGGLCQLANMLNWLFLHSPLTVVEHHHHNYDVFPDSRRGIPFGSGAGTLFNYYDLQFKNTTKYKFKINIWMDDEFLYGKLFSAQELPFTYRIVEKDHAFYKKADKNFRRNKLYKQTIDRNTGKVINETLVKENDSEVLYELQNEIFRDTQH